MERRLSARPTAEAADAIFSFWFEQSKPWQWFRRDPSFDAVIVERFGPLHEAATAGKLNVWRSHPRHALSFIILLDQFSRNMFRGSAQTFAADGIALNAAREAIWRRYDQLYAPRERAFFYMPFMHAEDLVVQNECVNLFNARMPDSGNLHHATQHRDIVARFGRFPHRNKVLGRQSTPEEISYLKSGGFNPVDYFTGVYSCGASGRIRVQSSSSGTDEPSS